MRVRRWSMGDDRDAANGGPRHRGAEASDLVACALVRGLVQSDMFISQVKCE